MNSINLKQFRNDFFFISDEKLLTILNFDAESYRFLVYEELVHSLDPIIPKQKKPVPTFAYDFRLHAHIVRIYTRTLFGQKFSENSRFYSIFFGFYLFIIWKLGGGRRFLPLVSTYFKCNYYGFYDLHFTPLAFIFSIPATIRWAIGTPSSISTGLKYFKYYNTLSIWGGPISDMDRESQLAVTYASNKNSSLFTVAAFRFVCFAVLIKILFFFPIFFVHLFIRPTFFWFNFFVFYFAQKFDPFSKYVSSLPYDYFWKKIYFLYFSSARRAIVIEEQGISPQEFDAKESDFVGFTYNDIALANNRIFSTLIHRLGKHSLRGYRPDSFSSFFSGYYLSAAVGRPIVQTVLLKHTSSYFIKRYKDRMLQHALSIRPAVIESKSNFSKWVYKTLKVQRSFHFDGSEDRDFFVFVRRFNLYVQHTIQLAKFQKVSSRFTWFYQHVKYKSLFIQIFDLKFSTILFRTFKQLAYTTARILLFPFNLMVILLSTSIFSDFRSRFNANDRSFAGTLFRFFSAFKFLVKGFLVFPFAVFGLIKLYFQIFFEYFLVLFRLVYNFIKKISYFNAYYSYFYLFRRYFYSFNFTRFFTREIEDELDQIQDIADLSDEFNIEEFGSTDFEFQDYDIGFEKPSSYDEFDAFSQDSYYDKSYIRSGVNDHIFNDDNRVENNVLFEQLFWGWFSINYAELSIFLFRQSEDYDKFKSFDPSPDSLDDSLFEDHQFISNYGLDDEQYSTDEERLEEDDYEEFYYDPEFMDSFERYYDYVLTDKTLVELNNKLLSYRLKLDKWHTRISKNFVSIPKEFLLMPSNLRQPNSTEDWKILTLLISTVVLNESQDRVFSARNDVEFINSVWSRFSKAVKSHPEKVYQQLDSADFERRYDLIEKQFSALPKGETFFYKILLFFFGSHISERLKPLFNTILVDVRVRLKGMIGYRHVDFSLLDKIYLSFISPNVIDSSALNSFKEEFSDMSRFDVLSIIFYLRFLADSDFPAFYKFISTPAGSFIWSKFETSFNLATKYSPKSYDFVSYDPFKSDLRSFLHLDNLISLYLESSDDVEYTRHNFTLEGLFTHTIRSIYTLFNISYDGLLAGNEVPRPGHPANVFGAGFDDEDNWNLMPDSGTTGPASNINLASTLFSDFVYSYFTDPNVAVTLFPFSYVDFIEDVTEVDEMDVALDIDDQYILYETDVSTLDSISFYVNEDNINDDAIDELDTFDPTDNQDDFGFMTDPAVFNTDDTETSGDLPFYDNDLELWIDDNLEGGEDWEPEELDSADDVSLPINRLFFGTLTSSSTILPATDYRLYSGMFSRFKHTDTGYDLDYAANLKLAYSAKSTKSLATSQHFYTATPGNINNATLEAVVPTWIVSISFFLSHLIKLYFYIVAFFFNVTFYTYSNDINHLKNALIFKHFSRNSSIYQAPLDFSGRLKSWIYGYEDFYYDNEAFARFRDNSLEYGDTYQGPRSNIFDRAFLNFGHHIPFSDFLFDGGRDADYEITDFLVYSQQDYIDFDNLNYRGTVDLYDNSRFTEVDELELFHIDLEESAPLDGLLNEEQDWDIGATYSYSSDDFIEDAQMFNNRMSVFISALSSLFSLIFDYYLYFFKVKTNKYTLNPFYYWNIRSSYEWTRLAATYGLSVYVIRYFFSVAIIFSISIYAYFVFPRIFYWFFVHTLDYGFFLFANAIFTFFVFFFAWLVFFPNFANFYSNFSKDEKLSLYFLVITIWVFYIFGGYTRFPWFPILQDSELFRNLGTEPDISPEPFAREYQGDINNTNLESNRSITFYDARSERELIYDSEKFPGDYNRRLLALTFDYRALNFGTFIDAIKYNVLGIRNSYFTGYKYMHTNYDFMFSRHIIDAYHSFLHRHYIVNLGGLPRRYARIMKRQTLNQFDRIRALDVAYSYSVALNSKEESQIADPTNYMIEDTFPNHNDNVPDYPYDFRPDSFYNSTDDYYSQLYIHEYGSTLKTLRQLTSYNTDYITPRKKIVFYKGRRYSRYNYEGHARKRRLSNYIYRYGRLGRFKHYRRSVSAHQLSTAANFYNQTLEYRYLQNSIKKGQFLFNYSANFSKFILFYNFPRAKGYIDMFTFRPSHLYPRATRRHGHREAFYNYYSAVDDVHHSDIYSEFDLKKRRYDEVKDIIKEEGFYGNWVKYTKLSARIDYLTKQKTFYRAHVSRLAIGKNSETLYKPFFNFLLYSRFVYQYNNYIIILYPHVKDNYYFALTKFTDKYLRTTSESSSYRAYLSGLGTYYSKFGRSPLTQSKFSRDPKRLIRKKYRRDSKDLFMSTSKRFPKLRTPVDVFYSNYSYKLKHYPRRMPFQKRNSKNRDKLLYRRKLYFYRKLPFFRQRYKKFFTNTLRYRTAVRRKRFYRRRIKRRFFSKIGSSVRYQNIFNNYRVYRDKWLYGLKSFNKTVASESKAIESVREHELKFKIIIKKLGDKIPQTAVTDRLEVKPYTLPVDFLVDFSNLRKPNFSYYRFSPINYAFNSLQFKLLKTEDKLPQSLFQFSGFERDNNFELNQDVRIIGKGISIMEDFNRIRLFRARKRFYKPYFYRYLEVSTNRKYKPYRLILALKKQFSEEFILSNLLPALDTSEPILPRLNKKFLVHHSVLRVRDPKNPENFITYKRLKKVVPQRVPKKLQVQHRYEDWYKRRFARLVYNWQKRSSLRTKRSTLRNSRHYARIGDRYDIGDYKAYVRRYKPRRPLFYIENRFFGPRYNETLGEAETLLAKEKRRKKAALKRLREKQKRDFELAKAKQKRLELRRAEKRRNTFTSDKKSHVNGDSNSADATNFGFDESFKNPFFDNDDPTKFM